MAILQTFIIIFVRKMELEINSFDLDWIRFGFLRIRFPGIGKKREWWLNQRLKAVKLTRKETEKLVNQSISF